MITLTAKRIVRLTGDYARQWQRANCNEKKEQCAATIRQAFFSKDSYGTAWCAMFVWVIANDIFGEKNPLLKTPSTIAMRDAARKNPAFVVDKQPTVGAIFFRYRDGGGHVGYVVSVHEDGKITTIEGNSSNAVGGREYKRSEYASWDFIHIERVPSKALVPLVLVSSAAVATAGFIAHYKGYIGWKRAA